MILLMGGTRDARQLVASIHATFPHTMIVATAVTPYGAQLLRQQGGCVVVEEAMNAEQLAVFIRAKEVRVLVDATHPFAENASAQAREAATETKILYLRYERPQTPIEAGNGVYWASDFPAAARIAARLGRTIFLTIGTRHLAECLAELSPTHKVVARVLPAQDSVRHCHSLGLTPANIVAVQGPVSQELNVALFRQYTADVIITKESGATGGTWEKIAAARECKIPIVLVRRPVTAGDVCTPAQIIVAMRKELQL
ncbi:MAG: precorrin-6A reductase [Firmicutes bacterium]|nr:precorrin-6A reductase [Bacillota bacterium]